MMGSSEKKPRSNLNSARLTAGAASLEILKVIESIRLAADSLPTPPAEMVNLEIPRDHNAFTLGCLEAAQDQLKHAYETLVSINIATASDLASEKEQA